MRRVAVPLLVLPLALQAVACGGREPDDRAHLTIRTDAGEATLSVEIADDPEERAVGLSGRASLPEDAGMAFLWEEPVAVGFWMRDTLIPLQIAFWDETGAIVAILDMEPCTEDPCPTFAPDSRFVGAVEANAGWFTDHGVRPGDTVELDAGAE